MNLDALDDLYQEIILDHYRSPRNNKALMNHDIKADVFNPFCGDQISLTLTFDGDKTVSQVGFQGEGCSISQASVSMMTELLKDRNIEQIQSLIGLFKRMMRGELITKNEEQEMGDLASLQGVRKFPIRIKCALLGWSALQDALQTYHPSSKR